MINVRVKKTSDFLEIEIKGHADYAKSGSDIVCSAVSTLIIYNLNLIEVLGFKKDIKDQIVKSGYTFLKVNLTNETLKTILKLFISSIVEIAKDYPKNLNVKKE